MGPKGWVKLGYKTNSYSLPNSSTESTGPISFGGLFLGLGGDIPVRGKWGALANFNLRFLSSVDQSWTGSSHSSSSDIELFVGGYYRWKPKMTIRGGLEIISNGADFPNNRNLTQKTITIGPSLLYYF
jgi:hypothetical protein